MLMSEDETNWEAFALWESRTKKVTYLLGSFEGLR